MNQRKLLGAILGMVITFTLFTGSALANSTAGVSPSKANATPTCPKGEKVVVVKGKATCQKPKPKSKPVYTIIGKDGTVTRVVKLTATPSKLTTDQKECFSNARKLEQPAPPRDPLAECKGKIDMLVVVDARVSCLKGWMGGSATIYIRIINKVDARAFAQAIASGRAEAWAITRISARLNIKASATVTCVKVTPPPVLDYCPNLSGVQPNVPSGYTVVNGQCVIIPTPVVDVCPNLDGVQPNVPSGYTVVNGQCVIVVTPPGCQVNCTPLPVPQPPALSNPTNPEQILANGETLPNICITVSGKNGNNLTVSFGSRYGSWVGGSTHTFTSGGVDRICKTYIAPRDQSVVGKNEQFTFNVHDNTTGLNGQEVKGLEFPVKAPPARP